MHACMQHMRTRAPAQIGSNGKKGGKRGGGGKKHTILSQLGTLGGGNHFLEFLKDAHVRG